MQGRGESLELRGVSVDLNGTPVLRRVSLSAPGASYLVILGPSGSGKTTLLRAVAGLVPVKEGAILIGGRDYTLAPPWERPVALVQQIPGLLPHLTVLENVELAARVKGGLTRGEARSLALELLGRLRISGVAHRRPGELSGGQLQRAAIAAALAANPSILLLDEPLSHLDRPLAEELRLMLKRLNKEYGVTIVHVTHDQDEALSLASHLALLQDGRVIAYGPASQVYNRPPSTEAARFLGHNVLPLKLLGLGGEGLASFPPEAVVLGSGPYEALVTDVARERGRLTVTLSFGGHQIRAFIHPLQGEGITSGVRVRFNIAWNLVAIWEYER